MTELKPSTQYHASPSHSEHTRLDALVSRAITYTGRAKFNRYVLCLIASRIVGQYERGATERLAQNIGVTVSRVEDFACAGKAYRYFRKFGLNTEIAMGVSSYHLAVALTWFNWLNKNEAWPDDITDLRTAAESIVSDLRTAAESKMTQEHFAKLMRDHYGEKPPAEWGKQLAVIESRLANLSVDTDAPEAARVLLSDLGRLAQRARVEERACIKRAWAVLDLLRSILKDPESDGWLLAWANGQADTLSKLLDERGA